MSNARRIVDALHELLDIPLEDAERLWRAGLAPVGVVLELSPIKRLELCAMLGSPLYARSHTQPAAGAGNNNLSTLSVPLGKNVLAVVLDAIFHCDATQSLLTALLDAGVPSTVVTSERGAALDRRPTAGTFAGDGSALLQTGHRVGAPGGSTVYTANVPITNERRVATLEGAVIAPNRSVSMFQGTANVGGYFSWRWYELTIGSND